MAWRKLPASPRQVRAAVRWFRKRVAVTPEQWKELEHDAKLQAFTLSGTTQLSVVQTALDEMAKAILKGEDLDAYKARLRKKLKDDFADKNSGRLKTAFQTQTQTALNVGRWYELEDTPGKPFRRYDAVLDHKTTVLCRSLDGTVVRADNPMLLLRWPPLHFNCRMQVRAIASRTARRHGVVEQLPLHQLPMAGFGYAPPMRAHFELERHKFDGGALAVYDKKQLKRPKPTPA